MTENTPGSVHRRTVVAGAAWTIPVVATAIGAPLAAASGESPTLAFTQAAYSASACSPLSGVRVTATTDGTTPAANQAVTITLPPGYRFADGSTSTVVTTDDSGAAVLPDILAPLSGGASSFTASSNGATATATVTAGSVASSIVRIDRPPLAPLPGGASPVTSYTVQDQNVGGFGSTFALTADGDLFRTTNGSTWVLENTDVSDFSPSNDFAEGSYVKDGAVLRIDRPALAPLPGGAGAVTSYTVQNQYVGGFGSTFALTATGDLYRTNDGTTWTLENTGVTNFAPSNNFQEASYVKDGTVVRVDRPTLAPLPGGVAAVQSFTVQDQNVGGFGATYALTADGDLYRTTNGTTWSLENTDVSGFAASNNYAEGSYVKNGAVLRVSRPALTPLPGGALAVESFTVQDQNVGGFGSTYALTADGELYRTNDGATWSLVSTDVIGFSPSNNFAEGSYVKKAC